MLVAKFGVGKFLAGEHIALAEMRAASRYYNALVQIERWRRSEYGVLRSSAVAGLSEIDAAYEQLDEWIGMAHQGPGGKRGGIREKRRAATALTGVPTKRVDIEQEVDVLAELKAWRREAGALAKPLRQQFQALLDPSVTEHTRRAAALRKEWGTSDGDKHAKRRSDIAARESMLTEPEWPDVWRRLVSLEATADDLRSWVKGARYLSVGTYYAVQQRDFPAACKRPKPRPDGEPLKPRARPGFSARRLRRIGWEIKGCTWGDVLDGKSGELRIENVREYGGVNGGRVKHRATASIRLRAEDRPRDGADPDYYRPTHAGEWRVNVEIELHRHIPLDTRVCWVFLVPEERAPGRWVYSVQLTLDPTEPLIKRVPGQGAVQVDLCWTQAGETLTVARVNGQPLQLPMGGARRGVVPALRHAEYLRSVADKLFDGARDQTKLRLGGLPERVQLECASLAHWRASRKLRWVSDLLLELLGNKQEELASWHRWRALCAETGRDLFEPDVSVYADAMSLTTPSTLFAFWLATWRRKDKHLEAMATGARNHGLGRRRDFYRVTAARLATEYGQCVVGGAVELSALALRDKSEDPSRELHRAARHNRQLAGVHELKQALAYTFGPERYSERSGAAQAPGSARDSENPAQMAVSGSDLAAEDGSG